ncbi:ABC transporter G family member 23 [Folsomia candida]|uniref:ABC transporter G family member 23 n=1 Tax=Folsomia candida TaxID=158441 RepID=A0A226D6A0_FOLCA|nr:ABC transporter G family member 23 [Folsomia candida]
MSNLADVPALKLVSGRKSYSNKVILDGVDITVEKGTIYALLGPSGCGKTTLVSCIVGIQQLSEGKIELFGRNVSTFRNGMPGSLIGYMPQETCLYESFTILETFIYYGRLYCMPLDKIVSNLATLKAVMNLPTVGRGVVCPSAWRCCMTFKFLFWTKATVGIDPVLRKRLPLGQLICLLVTIYLALYVAGYDPVGLSVGTITDYSCDPEAAKLLTSMPSGDFYTCKFLNILEKSKIKLTEFDALQALQMGSITGYLKFPGNFTENMLKRLVWNIHADEEIINGSTISILLDNSDTFWPIESVVWWYRYVCFCFPYTFPIRVFRCIMIRGWGITDPTVFRNGVCADTLHHSVNNDNFSG